MRQVVIARHGGPEVLRMEEVSDPLPGAGEVRIRVRASGVSFADVLARMGLYPDAPPPPCVVGYEVSGEIDAVGEGTNDLEVGDRVLALTRFGGYADTVVVPWQQAIHLPSGKDFVEAAALPVNFLTASLILDRLASVRAGDKVLIHGAAGGVGVAALQLAKALGAETFGTASASKHESLREMGLDHAIDYRSYDFEEELRKLTGGKGVDVILDPIGGSNARKSYRSLAPMGRLFLLGIASTIGSSKSKRRSLVSAAKAVVETPIFYPIKLMNENKGVFGVNLGHLWDEGEKIRNLFQELVQRWASGELQPRIDSTWPLEEAGKAHDRLQERKNFGKTILLP